GEIVVHRLDQAPRARIAHLHPPPGGGDRAGVADVLEELRLARTEGAPLAQDDAQAERGLAIGAGHRLQLSRQKKRAACAARKAMSRLELYGRRLCGVCY